MRLILLKGAATCYIRQQMKKTTFKKSYSRPILVTFLLIQSLLLTSCADDETKAQRYLESGNAYLQSGDTKKAILEYKNALKFKANSVDAIYGLAQAFQRVKDWDKVFQLCLQTVELKPDHVGANLNLVSLYIASNQIDKALERLDALSKIAPDNPEYLSIRAYYLLKTNDFAGAVTYAHKALVKDPANVQAGVVLVMDKLAVNDFPKALEEVNRALAKAPKESSLQLLKVKVLEQSKDFPAQEALLLSLTKDYPDNLDYLKQLALFYSGQKAYEKTIAILKQVIDKQPSQNVPIYDLTKYVKAVFGLDAALKTLETYIKKSENNTELKFFKAYLLESNGRSKEVEETLMHIIETSESVEDKLKAKELLASLYYQLGNVEQSESLIKEILSKDPRNQSAILIRVNRLMKAKNYKAAIAEARVLLKDAPNSSPVLLYLARAHELNGDLTLADKNYQLAASNANTDVNFVIPFVEFLIRQKEIDRAESALMPLVTVKPDDVFVLKQLANIKLLKGDVGSAEKIAQSIKDKNPEMGDVILGNIYVNQSNYNAGITAFESAFDQNPNNPEALLSLVKALVKADRKTEAMKILQDMIARNPELVNVKILLAQVLLKMHDNQGAIKLYREVIAQKPNDKNAYLQLSELLRDMGHFAEAKQATDEALSKIKDDFDLLSVLASIELGQNHFSEAISAYNRMLTINPDSEFAKNNYISLVADTVSDPQLLKNAYQISRTLNTSSSPYFSDTVGWIAYKTGNMQEAQAELMLAVDKSPKNALFNYHLGAVELAMQHHDRAKNILNQALKLDAGKNELPEAEIKKMIQSIH